MTENDAQPKPLTPAQLKAVQAIVASRDIRAAAAACGIAERTLWRWMQIERFKFALAEAEASLIDYSMRRLLLLQENAIDTLESVLVDSAASASVRLRAAQLALDMAVKVRELRDLEIRLVGLEAALLAKQ